MDRTRKPPGKFIGIVLFLVAGSASAAEYSASVEVSHAFHVINKFEKAIAPIAQLSAAHDQINAGPCARELAAVQATRREDDRIKYLQCFRGASQHNQTLMALGVRSPETVIKIHDQRVKELNVVRQQVKSDAAWNFAMAKMDSMMPARFDTSVAADELNRLRSALTKYELELEAKYDQVVARFERVSGDVRIERDGDILPARVGMEIRLFDRLVTVDRLSRAAVVFADRAPDKQSGPTIVNIGGSTVLKVVNFNFSYTAVDRRRRAGVLELLRGVIRMATKNWGPGSSFTIRTGVSLCGIRGTEVSIHYDPTNEEVLYQLGSGTVEVMPGNGRTLTMNAPSTLTVSNGVAGTVSPWFPQPPPT